MPTEIAMALFRITQEALTNVARHAQATRVAVAFRETPEGWALEITDNGRGIRDEEIHHPNALGLLGMRERLLPWQGRIEFERPPAGGTRVRVLIPRPNSSAKGGDHEKHPDRG